MELDKEERFFLKNSLLSAPLHGTRQSKKKIKKNSLPSGFFPGTQQSWETGQNWLRFPALPSVFGIALGKVTITDLFF
jgi:hypothetical protein